MSTRWLQGLVAIGLFAVVLPGCGDDKKKKDKSSKDDEGDEEEDKKGAAKALLNKAKKQCDALASACGKKEEHKKDIASGCQGSLQRQVDAGCGKEVIATLKCFEAEICSGPDAVQEYNDFMVLNARSGKCKDQMKAANKCLVKNMKD